MKEELKKEIESSTNDLVDLISSFSAEEINKVPFEGSWTPGQVADHILKSQKGILQMTKGNVEETDRDPAEKIEGLRRTFLDFTIKMNAPDFILPSKEPLDQQKLLERARKNGKEVSDAVDSMNLNVLCMDFTFPNSGPMTRLEWLYFIVFHTRRHNHQLKNMTEKIVG